jgi:hypothetical protein
MHVSHEIMSVYPSSLLVSWQNNLKNTRLSGHVHVLIMLNKSRKTNSAISDCITWQAKLNLF